jgi:hypothetical protein
LVFRLQKNAAKRASGIQPYSLGDLVIVYEGFGKQKAVTLTAGVGRGLYKSVESS